MELVAGLKLTIREMTRPNREVVVWWLGRPQGGTLCSPTPMEGEHVEDISRKEPRGLGHKANWTQNETI